MFARLPRAKTKKNCQGKTDVVAWKSVKAEPVSFSFFCNSFNGYDLVWCNNE